MAAFKFRCEKCNGSVGATTIICQACRNIDMPAEELYKDSGGFCTIPERTKTDD